MDSYQTNISLLLGECGMVIKKFIDLDLNFKFTVRLTKSNLSQDLIIVYTLAPKCEWNSDISGQK